MPAIVTQRSPGLVGVLYGKPSRNLSHDSKGLSLHAPALKHILALAHSVFSSQTDLRATMQLLQNRWAILAERDSPEHHVWKLASDAADIWCVMCKDVYSLAKKPCRHTELEPDVLELVHMSKLSARQGNRRVG